MRDTRLVVPSAPRTPQSPGAWPSHAGTRRRRRLPLLFAIAVVAAVVMPSSSALAAGRSPASAPNHAASAPPPCTSTVRGFTAAAVHSARDRAGVGGVVCFPAGTYTGSLSATVQGQTWSLDNAATLTAAVYISGAGTTLMDGIIRRPGVDRWDASVQIRADDVSILAVSFRGGGTGIGVYGKDRSRIIGNAFWTLTGSAVSIWSEGVGADRTRIQGNTIVQTATRKVSPITSRGNEGGGHGGVQNSGTIIRRNTIDQGAGDIGWFGIELKQSKLAVIERNTIKGGIVLISLPETDRATIRFNTFDLRGKPHWGVEVANAYDAVIDSNTFIGDGPAGNDYAISLNSGSLRTLARTNTASELRTFFAIAGDGHRVTDNCLRPSVRFEQEFMRDGGPDIIFARNRLC